MKKLCKLYTKPYILPVAILIFSALCCVGFAFQNPAQTIHKTLHSTLHFADSSLVAKCRVCASNYTRTIHKLYIEAFKTLHNTVRKPYIATACKPYTNRRTNPT